MMPSRGLHLSRGVAPRLYQLQCRNLSSAPRRISQTPLTRALVSRQWQAPASISAVPLLGIRHASSIPSTQQAASASSPPPPVESSGLPNLDTIIIDDGPSQLADIAGLPEKIGYLHEIGLHYGWGPTSVIEYVLEHLHISFGLPWWGAIAGTAVLLRLAVSPLYLKAADSTARERAMTSITRPINERMMAARQAGDNREVMVAMHQLRAVRKRAGIRISAQILPAVVQGVLGWCGYRLLHAMVTLPVPGLETGGFLWLRDLTLSDPYLLLPFMMATLMHMIMRMGGETGTQSNQVSSKMKTFMMWGMPGIVFVSMGFFSGATNLWFFAGTCMSAAQAMLFQRNWFRRRVGVVELVQLDGQTGKSSGSMLASLLGENEKPDKPASEPQSSADLKYQAPSLHYRSADRRPRPSQHGDGKTIDTQLAKKPSSATAKANTSPAKSDMVRPNAAPLKAGLIQRVRAAWKRRQEQTRAKEIKDAEARVARSQKERERLLAEDYERMAKERKTRRRS